MKIYKKIIPFDPKKVNNPYEYHRDVEKLFKRNGRRPYNCFSAKVDGSSIVYTVYSDLDPIDDSVKSRELTDEMLNRIFAEGNIFGFRITYNSRHSTPSSKRKSEYKAAFDGDVSGFINRKLVGFEILNHDNHDNRHYYLDGKNGHKVACFEVQGVFKVTSTVDAIRTFCNGIGREKYLGLGLIEVFPTRSTL